MVGDREPEINRLYAELATLRQQPGYRETQRYVECMRRLRSLEAEEAEEMGMEFDKRRSVKREDVERLIRRADELLAEHEPKGD